MSLSCSYSRLHLVLPMHKIIGILCCLVRSPGVLEAATRKPTCRVPKEGHGGRPILKAIDAPPPLFTLVRLIRGGGYVSLHQEQLANRPCSSWLRKQTSLFNS